MTSRYHTSAPKTLDSFCQTGSFFKTKIALLTFYNTTYSDWIQTIVLLVEYLQLISQTLLLRPNIYDHPSSDNQFLFSAIVYFFKLINPCYLLSFEGNDVFTSTILIIVFCSMILKYILFAHILCVAIWDCKKFDTLISIWKWVYRLQGRVMCFLITSFWVRTILTTYDGDFHFLGMSKIVVIILSSFMFALEYVFSLIIEMQLCYVLPTKNFLSSKGYQIQVTTLLQKLVLHIIQLTFKTGSLGSAWLFTTFNLLISAIRNYQYYMTLPLYNLKALLYQGDLLCLVISSNFASFCQTFLTAIDYKGADINFIVIIWTGMALLTIRLSREGLKRIVMSLLTSHTRGLPELLLHKVCATQQIARSQILPGSQTDKYDLTYLFSATLNADLQTIFGFNSKSFSNVKLNVTQSKDADKIFLQYLDELSLKFPKSSLIKLYIAYVCAENPTLFTRTIKIATDFRKSKWSASYLSSSLLLHEVERVILNDDNIEDNTLDIVSYIQSQNFVDRLKKEMLAQTELKIGICNNIIEDTSDVGHIYNCAQSIDKIIPRIQKRINLLSYSIPDYHVEPSLICAIYHLVLNYSFKDYWKYYNVYAQKYYKYEKQFKEATFTKENLHQESNAFLLLAGQKLESGRIMFFTKSILNICGGEKASYTGTYISSIFTPSLQGYYNDLFKQILEAGKQSVLNKVIPAYLRHKDGHIVEAEFVIRVHPYITQNLYLDMIIRPVPATREYLLIDENGDIEGATKKIAKTLSINVSSQLTSASSLINIKLLSEELFKVNAAFNIVNKAELAKNSSKAIDLNETSEKLNSTFEGALLNQVGYAKALELHSIYASEGKKVELMANRQILSASRFDMAQNSYSYHCNVQTLSYGSIVMKLITLEEASRVAPRNYDQEIINDKFKNKGGSINMMGLEELVDQQNENKNVSMTGSENIEYYEGDNGIEVMPQWTRNSNLLTDGTLLSPKNKNFNTEGNLLSPKSSSQSPTRIALITHKPEIKKIKFNPIKSQNTLSNSAVATKESFVPNQNKKQKKEKGRVYMSSHHSSQTSQERNTNKAFKRAINAKSYPKSFVILCFMFYAVILITFGSQLGLKISSDNTMDDLVLMRSLLKYSQLRSFRAIQVQINCRGAALQIGGVLSSGNISGNGYGVQQTLSVLEGYQKQLADYNHHILAGVNSLDDDLKENLFAKDIKIYGSLANSAEKSYRNVTNFEVIEEIINAVRTLAGLPNGVSAAGLQVFNYLTLNILNDFTFKNNEITDNFVASVKNRRLYLENVITLCLIITPILLAAMALMLTLIIWNQYSLEINCLLAFTKLSPGGVQGILISLKNFRKILTNEESFENSQLVNYFDNLASSPTSVQPTTYHKKQHTQIVKYSKIRTRYYGYITKVVVYTTILIGIMVWNYISAQKANKIIYKRQAQLQFVNQISDKVALAYAIFDELFISNNTNKIAHMTPEEAMIDWLADVKSIREQAPEMFSEVDKTYDPEIQALLYKDVPCSKLSDAYVDYCISLKRVGYSTNFLPLIASYEDLMTGNLLTYYKVPKTSAGLVGAAFANLNNFIPFYGVLRIESELLGTIIDRNLSASVSDTEFQRSLFLGIFSFSLLVVNLLIWYQILVKLREVNNDFKKVLHVFPPNLILSSFLLKSFLKRTTRDIPEI